ncbi:MAG: hypothetical protein ACYCST_12635 [Acidimicrobiales bacterium]
MQADVGIWARTTAPVRASGSPASVVAALSTRKTVRAGVLWGYIFAIAITSSEVSHVKLYKTAAQRDALAATYGTSKATSALFGPASRLQTVSGFTVFKISMTIMILGAVFGLLTSTRLLRGEEESGRWDLLLCGQTTRRGATTQVIAGLGAGLVSLWAVTAIITVLSGLQSSVGIGVGPSLYFSLAMVATAAMFLAVGAVTSQLAVTRRQAALFGAEFLGVRYGVRLIADAGAGLHRLIWVSPLGWVEELQPLTSPQPLVLLPIAAFTAVLVGVAVRLAGRRDAGASIVADRDHGEAHLGLLYGPRGLAIRLMRATVISCWVAIGLSALIYGFVAKSTGATVSGSVKAVLSKLGATGTGAAAVIGVCFLIEAVLIGFVAADVLGWLGAASQHTGLNFSSLLGTGVNLVPPAIVILGIGVLTFGIRPLATSIVAYAVLGWSLLMVIVGGFGTVSHWVLDTSVFHHMASAPGVAPNWETNGIMTAVGVAAALAGVLAFRRRDLQGS